jgi:uncharacterized protein (DUF924 family)
MSSTASAPSVLPILQFWFGDLDEHGRSDALHSRRWFMKDDAFDREITEKFADTFADIRAGRREQWLDNPHGRLAYVIVLDQFARNMFRGTPRMFEGDKQAEAAAVEGVARGDDAVLGANERWFLYMPFMHAEDAALQERSVALFTALAAAAPPELRASLATGVTYAEQHRDIIARFGRFPHRNAVLGRQSTPDELEFLKQPGSAF